MQTCMLNRSYTTVCLTLQPDNLQDLSLLWQENKGKHDRNQSRDKIL